MREAYPDTLSSYGAFAARQTCHAVEMRCDDGQCSYHDFLDRLQGLFTAEEITRHTGVFGHDIHVLGKILDEFLGLGIIRAVSRAEFVLANDSDDTFQ